jgi:type I restriction-modification system DNA methylase subunit
VALQAVKTEGGLLPADLLQRITSGDKQIAGMSPTDYHLLGAETTSEAITRAWNRLLGVWVAFRAERAKLPEGHEATTLTQNKWLLPLFAELGFGRLVKAGESAYKVGEASFEISHGYHRSPIHLVGAGVDLEKRQASTPGGRQASPHGLVQELLNKSDAHLWGFVSNGLRLRILRDHRSLTRLAYVELDLESIFEGELFHAFRLVWLLCHESRVEAEKPEECWLEKWHGLVQQEGVAALDKLRSGVEKAIEALGRGFLRHPDNAALKDMLAKSKLDKQDYYRELLRLVYRLIFLFVTEDREVLLTPSATETARERYRRFYSTRRLRELARKRRGAAHDDLWQSLRVVMDLVSAEAAFEGKREVLGLPALGGFLWARSSLEHLAGASLANEDLLAAVLALSTTTDKRGQRFSVNWRSLGAEELGSVYEGLLELHPKVSKDAGTFELSSAAGHERKTTGSYYTPASLVECLLDSALEPVIDQATQGKTGKDAEEAILGLAVCDPACGSGHFLLAAARRLARRIAQIRADYAEPSPSEVRHALRQVVARCLYGVDVNQMAVELCKVSLWMEAVEPGLPLTFLNSHIQHGNSLLGTTPELMAKGIPDAAWDPIAGDDKKTASALKKKNKLAARVEYDLFTSRPASEAEVHAVARSVAELEAASDANPAAIAKKEERWDGILGSPEYCNQKAVADAWCAAFVWPKQPGELTDAAPTNELWRQLRDGQGEAPVLTTRTVDELAGRYLFFHWHLQFPQVFAKGGFDVILGNPPWDLVRFSEDEFFATTRPEIVQAPTAAARKKLIAKLEVDDHELFAAYRASLREVDGINAFVRSGVCYPLCGVGRVNLFALFAELARSLVSRRGRVGQILPSGIVSDDSTKLFFQDVIQKRQLVSFFDFENREGIFGAVHRSFKFGILILAGERLPNTEAAFVFFATQVDHVKDADRRFTLSQDEIALLNPQTKTCPIFRSRRDAELTKAIYRDLPVLARSRWKVSHQRLINQSDDSSNFVAEPGEGLLPLYEGKYFHHYEHRWVTNDANGDRQLTEIERGNPDFTISPRHWYPAQDVRSRFGGAWKSSWTLAWRDITNSTNERTFIATVLPSIAVPNSARVVFIDDGQLSFLPLLIANLGSFVFDFVARQKIGGMHMSGFIVDQLPLIAPETHEGTLGWSREPLSTWLHPRVLELTYTAWDLEPFARDLGYEGPPFRWAPERRSLLRAEIDAAFFRLYGLSREDVEYVMDTFPIVRRNDEKAYGKFRTKETILDVFDAMAEAARTGKPYDTRLSPPPADPRIAHPSSESGKVIQLPIRPAVSPQPVVDPAAPRRDIPGWSPDLLPVVATRTGLAASAGRWGTTLTGVELGIAALAAVLRNMGGPASRDAVERAVVLSVLPGLLESKFDTQTAPMWRRAIGTANMKLSSIAALSILWAEVLRRATVEHLLVIDSDDRWRAGSDIDDAPSDVLDARALVSLSWLESVSGAAIEDAELITQLGALRAA